MVAALLCFYNDKDLSLIYFSCSDIFIDFLNTHYFSRISNELAVFRQEFLLTLLDTIHEELSEARKPHNPEVEAITHETIIEGSPDSAFLSGSSTEMSQVSLFYPAIFFLIFSRASKAKARKIVEFEKERIQIRLYQMTKMKILTRKTHLVPVLPIRLLP